MNFESHVAILGPLAMRWAEARSSHYNFTIYTTSSAVPESTAVVISDDLTALAQLRQSHAHVQRILLFSKQQNNLPLLKYALEELEIFQILADEDEESKVTALLSSAFVQSQAEQKRRRLVLELKLRNNKLIEVTDGLEKAVRDRTQGVADSKAKIEKKISRMNELIRFVKELTFQRGVDDLLLLIRREVRSFHGVFESVLLCETTQKIQKLFYFRNGNVVERETRIRRENLTDSQYLANELGRPVSRVIYIALNSQSGLFFEHSLGSEDIAKFVDFLRERLQSFSLALDRLILELELRSASRLWEQTFDGIEEPIAVIDHQFQLLRSNRYFSEDLILNKCYGHFNHRDAICDGCPLEQSLKLQKMESGQVRRGSQIYDVYTYPIQFEHQHDRSTTFVNHYVDVTKSLELQSQVVQNEKMAAIGHLAGHIAHELNNPLSGIRGLAQILLKTVDPGRSLASDLIEVEKAATRCHLIIENLLEFSKGQNKAKLIDADFNDVILKTLPLLKSAMSISNTEINLSEQPLTIRASPHLLQQVVFNVVNNACQAMGEAGGTLKVVSQRVDGWAQLAVTDSGSGIPEDVKDKIFQPFFTTKAAGTGTGLGLSLCKNVVESFGGQIFFDSEIHHGTTLYIRLPMMKSRQ